MNLCIVWQGSVEAYDLARVRDIEVQYFRPLGLEALLWCSGKATATVLILHCQL